MAVVVTEDPRRNLAAYARVPIAFQVREVFDVSAEPDDVGRYSLTPRAAEAPRVKDYDSDGGGPETWAARFDLSHWRFFVARLDGRRVGGAAVVFRAPDVDMLRGEQDLAVLWDIRVEPGARGQGVGTALMSAAESWCAARGARWLEVETQNVNVPACRFYAARGFTLHEVDRRAYPSLPDEIQLIWRKEIVRRSR